MTQIVWDKSTEHIYETGVDHGVLYVMNPSDGTYPLGIPWNGLTGVTESPGGAEATPLYADNIKYLNILSAETFGATLEAFTYPKEFGECDGSAEPTPGLKFGQQGRKTFGLAYRTILGNDALGNAYGYKLHLVYGCVAAPSEKAYSTINDSPEAIAFSWTLNTVPSTASGYRAVSVITIDSTLVDPTKLATLEAILFGTVGADPRLPFPDEVSSVLVEAAPSALSVSSVPLGDATGVAVTANVVLTFNNEILEEFVLVTSAAGVLVAGAKTWDTDHKIMTFDPTSSLSGSTTYIVTIAGVVDVYGQSLAASARKFATI
jgi:hypothetical protein